MSRKFRVALELHTRTVYEDVTAPDEFAAIREALALNSRAVSAKVAREFCPECGDLTCARSEDSGMACTTRAPK